MRTVAFLITCIVFAVILFVSSGEWPDFAISSDINGTGILDPYGDLLALHQLGNYSTGT